MNLLTAQKFESDKVRARRENITYWVLYVGMVLLAGLLAAFFWHLQANLIASAVVSALQRGN